MIWDKNRKILYLDLVDLEHCGFSSGDFDWELEVHGIDDLGARWPIALVVNFAGGHIVTPNTSEETLEKSAQARQEFERVVRALSEGAGGKPEKKEPSDVKPL